jgi:hypothetical protein
LDVEPGLTAGVEAGDVGATAGADVSEAVGLSVGREVARVAVGSEVFRAAVGLPISGDRAVPGEESGAVARGVAGYVECGCGTNGALMVGPPSAELISRAT